MCTSVTMDECIIYDRHVCVTVVVELYHSCRLLATSFDIHSKVRLGPFLTICEVGSKTLKGHSVVRQWVSHLYHIFFSMLVSRDTSLPTNEGAADLRLHTYQSNLGLWLAVNEKSQRHSTQLATSIPCKPVLYASEPLYLVKLSIFSPQHVEFVIHLKCLQF